MSWRVSFYKADKTTPIIEVRDEEDYPHKEVNGEQLLNNEGTNIWKEDVSEEEKNNPELFQKLADDPDYDFYLVTRQGLRLLIEKYNKRVAYVFELMMKGDLSVGLPEEQIRKKHFFWSHDLVVNMRDDLFGVTRGDYYEYTIFNLVLLYKTFDFEHYSLVIWGK